MKPVIVCFTTVDSPELSYLNAEEAHQTLEPGGGVIIS